MENQPKLFNDLGKTEPENLNEKASNLVTRREKIKKNLNDLLLNSSVNGLPNIFSARNLVLKIMWSFCFIISICVGSYYTIDSIIDYFKFSTLTVIKLIDEPQSQFPTISFCSYPEFNLTLDKIIISVTFERIDDTNLSNFEQFNDATYGKCFRYNSGKNQNLLYSSKSGYSFCLRFDLYFETQNNYNFGELLLNIHNYSMPPYDMEDGGYWLRPGSWNYFEIERVFTQKLEEPYNNCLKNISLFKMNKTLINHISKLNLGYSQLICFRFCGNMFALEESNCSCGSTLDNFEKDCSQSIAVSIIKNVSSCISEYLKEFRKSLQYTKCYEYCPSECDSLSYNVYSNYENFPASGEINTFVKTNYPYLERFNTFEEVNNHYIGIRIFYKDLKYTLITQEPKTEAFNFISNIGGILGLFLGMSFLSFIEIFEILFEILLVVIQYCKKV